MNKAQIVRAAAARGATFAETAQELGCSATTVRRIWRALGLPMPRRGPRPRARVPGDAAKVERVSRARPTIGPIEEERIVRAAAARHATLKQTAEELGCSVKKARRIWLGLRLPMGQRGRRHAPTYLAEVERALRAGRTTLEVARDHGVSRQAISDLARRHGFPVQALRRSAGWGMTFSQYVAATASGGKKELRGVMVWVPGR